VDGDAPTIAFVDALEDEDMAGKKVTRVTLYKMREEGVPISWLTCYDYPTAAFMDEAGIEMILVGDSASMTVYGNPDTMPITMETLLGHTKAVRKGAPNAFLVGDMPFLSYHRSVEDAIWNAGRFMKEAGCDAVKLEGGVRVADKVRGMVNAGIPVIGHIGLTPQSSAMLGGFRVQGKDVESAKLMLEDAKALAEAGVMSILLECVPTPVAQLIKRSVDVLVFGIGAGPDLDGQLLIVHDILGLFQAFQPKFVKQYANLGKASIDAFKEYIDDVRDGRFPQKEHEYTMPEEEEKRLREMFDV